MSRWFLVSLGLLALAGTGADWRQFRGPHSAGVAVDESGPRDIGPAQNVAWKAELPGRGLSSPIVVGDRVIVTACTGPKQDRLHVLAFDAGTGKQLWKRSVWGTGPTDSHPKTCMAAPTPASDGRRIVALFATDDMVCVDLDGRVLWVRALHEEHPGVTDGRGLASSPIIVGETVVVHLENQNLSMAVGIDLANGQDRWRKERPHEPAWTTPIALPGKTPVEELVLFQGATRLSACDPKTGREVWFLERGSHPIASSVVHGEVLLVPGETGLDAFQLQGAAAPKLLWEKPKLNPSGASPVVFNNYIYSLRGPILVRGDLKTGEVLGQLRLKGGDFSSSIVAAGGLLYCFNEEGVAHVIQPGEKEDVLLKSAPLEETILCTPAIARGGLFVRSDKHLWKFAKA